jgi:hypothetical protein
VTSGELWLPSFHAKRIATPWLIHPESKFKHVWNGVLVILLVYTFTLMPYIVSFEDAPMFTTLWFIDTVVDILFLCDILIILNTAIMDGTTMITSRQEIFCRYLKGFLLIDVLAIFPFYLVTESSSGGRANNFVRFLRMSRLGRIIRASKFSGLAKTIEESESLIRL